MRGEVTIILSKLWDCVYLIYVDKASIVVMSETVSEQVFCKHCNNIIYVRGGENVLHHVFTGTEINAR